MRQMRMQLLHYFNALDLAWQLKFPASDDNIVSFSAALRSYHLVDLISEELNSLLLWER